MAHKKSRSQFDIMHPLYDAIAESDLTAPQAHLLLTLFKFVDGNGVCFPSYNTLQKYTKMSRHTLCKHIKSLSDLGWISYQPGDKAKGQSNTYELNLERLGFTTQTNVVPIESGFIASDGSKWDCAADYWKHRQKH
ncbi:helix-turn-helix domain-containing protein [Vibrio parahaemolyticus]|nr:MULTISPECIES: helix-turn-helix domain-containing protein [Vibrio]EGQ9211996.1 helix-turn-helix domain-containing protein [Vibrio parahaemolyticus]EGR1326953.1 helix-turn-helix domain-containing protein [Vibrio parahaemolyticus]EIU6823135.1 helix-turn-helix domain-containing protein [Vibrio parahaemolyticus]EIV8512105.1 helix-turn-helix domain-containing protein [Vibrio parahaemolyticus]EJR2791874.1 helix-turn-helix domain-containing protein [Vibrio parahaemolyticus]